MLRAVPSTIFSAAAMDAALRSFILVEQTSRTCARVTEATVSLFGTPEPFAIPAARFNSTAAGGERAAILYSLVESCRMQGIEPHFYLSSVIDQVSTHPVSRIGELTPRGWAAEIRAKVGE